MKKEKEELIHLYMILVEIKKRFEESGVANNGSFKKYNKLNINPMQLYKPIKKHKQAVMVLAEELAQCTIQV